MKRGIFVSGNIAKLMDWIKPIVIATVLIVLVRSFLVTPIVVDGASMKPTLENGDRLIVKKISDFERFDIVVFNTSIGTKYVKRIIGMPGDHIAYKNDELFINGILFEEPYLNSSKSQLEGALPFTLDFSLEETLNISKIPDGFYFVIGDNRRNSNDSRNAEIGLVAEKEIIGTTDVRFYPFNDIELLK